ncbi:MAG: AI-2E family transporter [Coleofasciculus sp. S288]|nr:AI-2E family transporter [Coleofasciculus sp. S288]
MNLGRSIGLLALILALYILWQIHQVLLLLFTAVVLATALNQLVQQFQRLGIGRGWSVFLSLDILFVIFIIFLWLVVPPFVEQFQELVSLLPRGLQVVQNAINWLEDRLLGTTFPNFTGIENIIQQIQPLATQVVERSVGLFSTSITAVLQLVLVLVITLMLLVNPQPYRQLFIQLFPSFYRQRVNEILSRCETALGSWTVGALMEMVFVGALSGIGLWILQVPLALAHAILAGLFNFIPNIGPTLSVVLPMAIALLDAPWKAGAVLLLYIVIQQVESYWLTPTIMAKQVSLLPAITLTSQIVFTSFFGALGLLMALPLTVVAKTWLEEVLIKDILDKWNYRQPQPDNQ